MKKIVLTAAALLAISGSAFAGSDNYGSKAANPAVTVDQSYTASVGKSEPATQVPVKTGADHNLFGNN
jgi:hypothetical protein